MEFARTIRVFQRIDIVAPIEIIERVKFDNPSIHRHDRSLSGLCTGTSIKRAGVTWTQTNIILFVSRIILHMII